jgi:hypothetical protein
MLAAKPLVLSFCTKLEALACLWSNETTAMAAGSETVALSTPNSPSNSWRTRPAQPPHFIPCTSNRTCVCVCVCVCFACVRVCFTLCECVFYFRKHHQEPSRQSHYKEPSHEMRGYTYAQTFSRAVIFVCVRLCVVCVCVCVSLSL